jgi:type I restriction enzyme, S subunit
LHPYGKKMLFAKAKPSNNMSNFSAGEFCRIELPVPEIALQRWFAKEVAEVKTLKNKRLAGLKDATELFGSLVQRAFRGEL